MSSATEPAPPRRGFDLVAWFKLVRFPLVFTAIADSAAGFLLAESRTRLFVTVLPLLAACSASLYLFGMALNDIADLEKDRAGAPSKVLPSGRIPRGAAIGLAVVLLLISLGSVCMMAETSLLQRLLVWGGMLAAILAYDLHWVKAPPIMGLVRALNVILGVVAVVEFRFDSMGGPHPWKLALIGLPALVYGTSLTYVSTLEDSGVERRKLFIGVAGMAVGALLAAMVLPLLHVGKGGDGTQVNVASGLVTAWLLIGWIVRRAWKATDRKLLMLVVRDGVAGYILLDAAMVFPLDFPIRGLLIASLLIPAAASLALFKRLA